GGPRPERALLRDRSAHRRRYRKTGLGTRAGGAVMSDTVKLRDYHAARWDEPIVMEMGHAGRRGQVFAKAGKVSALIPKGLARTQAPALPEMTEPEVQRHYLHLAQETQGMVNISLFGTCTMKYNARVSEEVMRQPHVADMHP